MIPVYGAITKNEPGRQNYITYIRLNGLNRDSKASLPTFLQFFYNNELGKEALEARTSTPLSIDSGSLAPFFRARSRNGPKILTDKR